jgi:hypothetical protein
MKGKLLFLCTSHFDLYKIFQNAFECHSGCEVTTILYRNYRYRNKMEKIRNFFSKTFFGKDLRKIWASAESISGIPEKKRYDYAFVICPELFHPEHLRHALQKAKHSIAYYWDGFDHFPAYLQTMEYFDSRYSFDPVDAERYDLKFISNFYSYEDRTAAHDYDVYFLGSYDESRLATVLQIVSLLERQRQRVMIKLLPIGKATTEQNLPSAITFIDRFIPSREAAEQMKKSRIILDIQNPIQHGLTFRVFEAMGLGKKLITTNADIVNYDFYNPNNIFIWNPSTRSIPDEFFTSPYQELSATIYKKYSREHWVKTVLGLPGGAEHSPRPERSIRRRPTTI